jgi:2-oxoglutarate ferredoxin oxidoreductase subunit delta
MMTATKECMADEKQRSKGLTIDMKLWRTPLDIEKFSIPNGEAHILRSRCKGCELCVRYCPRDVLEVSEEMNEKGYHPPRAVHPERCVACRLCELLCPEFCIYIVQEDQGE